MNARMKELVAKADEYADSLGLGGAEWCDAQLEKLTELLVQECATMCINEGRAHDQWFGSHCAITVKEHFGVK